MNRGSIAVNRRGAALLAMLLVGALVAVLPWPAWLPPGPYILSPEPGCDLHQGACRAAAAGDAAITLRIAPLSIPLLDELQLEVRLEGIEARRVEVQFRGIDVDMGLLRYPLQAAGRDVFQGPAWLSVCSQRRMTWEALVVADGGRYKASFQFDTAFWRGFTITE